MKYYRKEKRRRKHSKSDNSSSSSGLDTATSNFENLESDIGPRTKNRNQGHSSSQERKGKSIVKVKTEEDESRKMMKSTQKSLEAIKVNLAENQKPRKIVSTSRANVWFPRCGELSHFTSECSKPA